MKYRISEDSDQFLDMGDMDNTFFLIGLLNEFMNSFQTVGDRFFEEMSWKQCFVLICIGLFEEPPTLKELSEVMGSSHQNVKQMLNKLEKTGYVSFAQDSKDKRKQRIILTKQAAEFSERHNEPSAIFMKQLFANVAPKDLEITVQTIMQMDAQLKKMKEGK